MSVKRRRKWPLYVWLFTLYPILFLFSHNIGRVIEEQVLLSISIALLGARVDGRMDQVHPGQYSSGRERREPPSLKTTQPIPRM